MRGYAIWTFWNDEVGAGIARRAQPARFRNGILFVTVATHSWMQELQFMKDDIRERLNTRLGANLVHDIFFVSGNVDAGTEATAPPADAAPPQVRASVPLPPIADPALAAAFARVVAAHARRVTQARPEPPRTRKSR